MGKALKDSILRIRRLVHDVDEDDFSDNQIMRLFARAEQQFCRDTMHLVDVKALEPAPIDCIGVTHRWEQDMLKYRKVTLGDELFTTADAASDPNGNEANSVAAWTGLTGGETIAASTLDPAEGDYCVKVNTISGQSSAAYAGVTTTPTPGDVYRVSYRIKVTGAHKVYVVMRHGTYYGHWVNGYKPNPVWVSDSAYIVVPDNADLGIYVGFIGLEATEFFVDSLSIKKVTSYDGIVELSTPNLIPNGNMELIQSGGVDKPSQWSSSNCTLSAETSEVHRGKRSAKAVISAGQTQATFYQYLNVLKYGLPMCVGGFMKFEDPADDDDYYLWMRTDSNEGVLAIKELLNSDITDEEWHHLEVQCRSGSAVNFATRFYVKGAAGSIGYLDDAYAYAILGGVVGFITDNSFLVGYEANGYVCTQPWEAEMLATGSGTSEGGYSITSGFEAVQTPSDPINIVPFFLPHDFYKMRELLYDYKVIHEKDFRKLDYLIDDAGHRVGDVIYDYAQVEGLKNNAFVPDSVPDLDEDWKQDRDSAAEERLERYKFHAIYQQVPERIDYEYSEIQTYAPFVKYIEYKVASQLLRAETEKRNELRAAHYDARYAIGLSLVRMAGQRIKQDLTVQLRTYKGSHLRGKKPRHPRLPDHYPALRIR